MPELNHSRTEETLTGKYRDSIMKKHLLLFAVLSTVFTVIACNALIETELEQTQEEEATPPAPEVKLVPMTFTATYSYDGVDEEETKTVLNGFKIEWKAGDKIAVYDDVDSSVAHEFTAESDGETTTFTGSVAARAAKFFAVYPYSAAEGCSSTPFTESEKDFEGFLNVRIPNVQRPVAGTFDPSAAVLVAYTAESANALNFKVPFALVKFTVDYDDVYSVSFSSEKRMTGSLKTKMRANGSIGTNDGDNDKYTTLTIKNADNSPLTRGETYYAVMRYRTGDNSYTSFTATLGNTACGYAERVASKVIPLAIATVNNLGNFTGMTFTTNRYKGYMDGLDVTISGNVYNKAADGDAVELRTDQNISDSRITAKVHFLVGGGSYTASGLTVNKDVVIAGENPAERATIAPYSTGSQWKLQSGSLTMSDVVFNMSTLTSSAIFSNSGATADLGRLAMDNCAIAAEGGAKYLWAPSDKGYAIEEIYLNGCLFRTSGTLVALIYVSSDHTAPNHFEKFEFTNNVVYSSTGSNVILQEFVFTGKGTTTGWNTDVIINNNLFYNAVASGMFRSYDMKSVEISRNVLFAADGTDPGSNAKIFALSVTNSGTYAASAVSEYNFVYGTLATGRSWALADKALRDGTSLTNPTSCPASPIDAATNTATGTFVLTDDYDEYGPQPMPIPM